MANRTTTGILNPGERLNVVGQAIVELRIGVQLISSTSVSGATAHGPFNLPVEFLVCASVDRVTVEKTSQPTDVGRLIAFRILTGAGTYSLPVGVRSAQLILIGAGGGSCGLPAAAGTGATQAISAAAAGGGAWLHKYIEELAASYEYSAGAGGAAGAAGSNAGGNGGDTTFGVLTAPGGQGSASNTANNAAAPTPGGALPTGGDINAPGQAGGTYLALGVGATSRFVPAGGSTPWGTGAQPVAATVGVNTAAAQGNGFGAGARPGMSNDNVAGAIAGAAGRDGAILVWEFS